MTEKQCRNCEWFDYALGSDTFGLCDCDNVKDRFAVEPQNATLWIDDDFGCLFFTGKDDEKNTCA